MEDDVKDLLPLPVQIGLNSSILDMYEAAIKEKEREQAAEEQALIPAAPDLPLPDEEPGMSVQGTENDESS
jgi:hypothetical protein